MSIVIYNLSGCSQYLLFIQNNEGELSQTWDLTIQYWHNGVINVKTATFPESAYTLLTFLYVTAQWLSHLNALPTNLVSKAYTFLFYNKNILQENVFKATRFVGIYHVAEVLVSLVGMFELAVWHHFIGDLTEPFDKRQVMVSAVNV